MKALSRTLRRWELIRIAAAALAVAWLVVLAAFAFGATSVQPGPSGIVAAVAALLIAGTGFLYAWREPGR